MTSTQHKGPAGGHGETLWATCLSPPSPLHPPHRPPGLIPGTLCQVPSQAGLQPRAGTGTTRVRAATDSSCTHVPDLVLSVPLSFQGLELGPQACSRPACAHQALGLLVLLALPFTAHGHSRPEGSESISAEAHLQPSSQDPTGPGQLAQPGTGPAEAITGAWVFGQFLLTLDSPGVRSCGKGPRKLQDVHRIWPQVGLHPGPSSRALGCCGAPGEPFPPPGLAPSPPHGETHSDSSKQQASEHRY